MYLSVEVITFIVSAASLMVTLGGGLFAGFAWVLRRMDEQSSNVDAKFDSRFDTLSTQMSTLQTELNDVQVSVARLEGPRPRLILPR